MSPKDNKPEKKVGKQEKESNKVLQFHAQREQAQREMELKFAPVRIAAALENIDDLLERLVEAIEYVTIPAK
jgi:hypothetical protein